MAWMAQWAPAILPYQWEADLIYFMKLARLHSGRALGWEKAGVSNEEAQAGI
jgi:hypothetical protein